MSILSTYRYFLLRKRSSAVVRQQRIASFADARQIGILWHEADVAARDKIVEQVNRAQVKILELVWTESKDIPAEPVFNRKSLNWLGFPAGEQFRTFLDAEFDLLINLAVKPNFAFDALTALSIASFKAGWDMNSLRYLDLSVDVSSQPEADYLAEQLVVYIQQLNKK